MKNIYLLSVRVKLFTVSTLFCLITSFVYGANIVVVPTAINFDCESASNTHDALTISDSIGYPVAIPEWSSYIDQYIPLAFRVIQNDRVAYVRGQTNPLIKVCFESNYKEFVHLLIKLSYVTGSSDGIGTICNFFIPNYDTNKSDFTTLSLIGILPNSLGIHEFKWKWEIYAIPTIIGPNYCPATTIINTTHSYYTLLAAPVEPMVSPWSGVLDLSCKWASGQTTDTNALDSLTKNLYNSGVTYDMGYHYTSISENPPYPDSNLNLSRLLQDFSAPNSVLMDCRDFANFLGVLCSSIGLSSESKKYGMYPDYDTNPILPAGIDSFPSPIKVKWNYHRVLLYNAKVADAATQIDGDEYPNLPPFKATLATGNMSDTLYLTKLIPYTVKYIYDADEITVF